MKKMKGEHKTKREGLGVKGKHNKTATSKKGKRSRNEKEVSEKIKLTNLPSARSPPHWDVTPPSPHPKTDRPRDSQSTQSPSLEKFVRRSPPTTTKEKRDSRSPPTLSKRGCPDYVTPDSERDLSTAQSSHRHEGKKSSKSTGESSCSSKKRKSDSHSSALEVPNFLGRSCEGVSPRDPHTEKKKSPFPSFRKFPSPSFSHKSDTEIETPPKSSAKTEDPALSLLTDSSETCFVEVSDNLTAKSRGHSAQISNDPSSYISMRHQSVPQSSSSDREEILIPRTSGSAPSRAYFHGTSKVDFVMCHLKIFEESEKLFLDDLHRLIQVHVLIAFIFESEFIFSSFLQFRTCAEERSLPSLEDISKVIPNSLKDIKSVHHSVYSVRLKEVFLSSFLHLRSHAF